jgi:F0F1-type ATP synthase assembly protein I
VNGRVINLLTFGRSLANRLLFIQLLVGFCIAFSLFLSGPAYALGGAVGATISLLGNGFFVFAVFRHAGAQRAQSIATSLFVGEIGKLIIVVTLFALVFLLAQLPALPILTGFIGTQAVFWIAPLLFKKSAQVKHA